ncbi:hypothetical protein KL86PLE_70153 [uncultured Pleomorphomonas sp.]|uniref:Uncharacterized protein n=1 Tax=uncultured Pleomorphomonas sp. TaxID=442121 RepID=A0A212LLL2_9HYPH|nr:hypothetical protein KL86PLE_70153 [uncultured Pleomorphomonas sp.]
MVPRRFGHQRLRHVHGQPREGGARGRPAGIGGADRRPLRRHHPVGGGGARDGGGGRRLIPDALYRPSSARPDTSGRAFCYH